MLGFQTFSCLYEIPVVRSSTTKLHDVYSKAKDTSEFIRLPCSLAETAVDRALQVAFKVACPLAEPLSKPASVIDHYAADKIRQMEQKYPIINTPTESVVNTFSAKTKPVLNAMNTVKDATTSTMQHGKETVSNVATTTVHKVSDAADSVYSFCQAYVRRIPHRKFTNKNEVIDHIRQQVGSIFNYAFKPVESTLVWFKISLFQFLVKTKQINDVLLNKVQRTPFFNDSPQRLLILISTLLENIIQNIKPNESKSTKSRKSQPRPRSNLQAQVFNRDYLKSNLFATIRKYVTIQEQERSATSTEDFKTSSTTQQNHLSMMDKEELCIRLPSNQLHEAENDSFTIKSTVGMLSSELETLSDQIKSTDVEHVFSRSSADALSDYPDYQESLTRDQQEIQARIINTELKEHDYIMEENDNEKSN